MPGRPRRRKPAASKRVVALKEIPRAGGAPRRVAVLDCGHFIDIQGDPPAKIACDLCRDCPRGCGGSLDIFGHPLQTGHCAVHPYVEEPLPCFMCREEEGREHQDLEDHLGWLDELDSKDRPVEGPAT